MWTGDEMAQAERAGTGWADLFRGGRAPLVIALTLGVWLHAADNLLIVTTLPSAVAEIGGDAWVPWAFTLYMLATIMVSAMTGLIALSFGLRRAFIIAGTLFAAGCVVSALASDMAVMLVGRFIQGMGGGGQVALVYITLDRMFPKAMMPKLVALVSAVWSMSAFCGPLVGGLFASHGMWRGAFWAFALQAVLFVVLVAATVDRDRRDGKPETAGGIPVVRLALLAAGILLVSLAAVDPEPVIAPAMMVASAAVFALFLWRDGRAGDHRMLPPRPFSTATLYGSGLLFAVLLTTATASFSTYGPFFLERLFGLTPLESGYVIAIESLAWGVVAVTVANVGLGTERWLIRSAPVLAAAALVGLAVTMPFGRVWLIVPFVVLLGACFGQMWGLVIRRVTEAAPPADRERTAAAIPTVQELGYVLGVALCGVIANALGFAGDAPEETLRTISVWVFAAFVPLAVAAVWPAWRMSRKQS